MKMKYIVIINIINKIERAQKYKELMNGPEMFEDILKNM